MKKIQFGNLSSSKGFWFMIKKKECPFTVYEEDRETPCHSVEIEGPCVLRSDDKEIWIEAEDDVKMFKLVNIPKENISFNPDEILKLKTPKINE